MNNDLISREALKKKLQARHDNGEEDFDKGYNIGIEAAIELLDNAPTVELTELCKGCQYLKDCETCDKSERPQGEWIEGWDGYFETLDCSLCGYVRNERHLRLNFCPNCGAKMKGGAE